MEVGRTLPQPSKWAIGLGKLMGLFSFSAGTSCPHQNTSDFLTPVNLFHLDTQVFFSTMKNKTTLTEVILLGLTDVRTSGGNFHFSSPCLLIQHYWKPGYPHSHLAGLPTSHSYVFLSLERLLLRNFFHKHLHSQGPDQRYKREQEN